MNEHNELSSTEFWQGMHQQDQRYLKLCYKVGVDEQGKPTGNGLLHRIERLEAQVERLKPINMAKSMVALAGLVSAIWGFVVLIVKFIGQGGAS